MAALTPQRAAQLDALRGLDHKDTWSPEDYRLARGLAAGTITVLPPLRSASEWIAWRAHLQQSLAHHQDQLVMLHARYDLATTVASMGGLATAIRDTLGDIQRTLRGIEECERELARSAAAEAEQKT